MAKAKDVNDSAAIDLYIQMLEQPLADLVQSIRQIILSTDPVISEQIKWNAPSFFYQGEMQPFDPKEYKRDIIVLNLRQKDHVLLIFPTGAKVTDSWGILEGDYKDGRRMVTIKSLDELEERKEPLQKVIKALLQLVVNN